MNVLIFYTDAAKLQVLSFCLESQLNLQVVQAATLETAMSKLLEEKGIDLIVAGDSDKLPMLMKYLLSVGSQIPVILVTQNSEKSQTQFPGVPVVGQIPDSKISTELPNFIKSNYQVLMDLTTPDPSFCRINVQLLCDVTPLAADVYVRLSNIKLVKLFKSGTIFTERDLNRLWGVRQIDYLYIRRDDAVEFVDRLKDRLVSASNLNVENDDHMLATVARVQETIHDLTNKIGFTEQVVNLAKSQVELTLKVIGKFPRLSRIFEGSMLRNTNYTSQHSIMVAHVACAIAANLDWQSDSTYQKLIIASFLHDLTLPNPEHAKIRTKEDLLNHRESFTPVELADIENHPFTAGQLVNKMTEIPGDVYMVVLQHHERPDGRGFPRGLGASTIAPLAAVFIVAHDLVDMYMDLRENFDMDKFWKDRLDHYSSGTFKKIAKAFLANPAGSPAIVDPTPIRKAA